MIVRALQRQVPHLDIVRAQQVGLAGADDPPVLAWAAAEGRVLLTHGRATMTQHAFERVAAGSRMPGVVNVRQDLPVGQMVEELLRLLECSRDDEWEGRMHYLPL